MYQNIPAQMRPHVQWIAWKYEEREGTKPTKLPVNVRNGHLASVANPETWCEWDRALDYVTRYAANEGGLGFVFTRNDGLTGVDCDATDNAEWLARQQRIVQSFQTYTEFSPSGTGVHMIAAGKVPSGRRRFGVEIYPHSRFFTMTGNVVLPYTTIEPREHHLQRLWEEMKPPGADAHAQGGFAGDPIQREDDLTVWNRANEARNGELFNTLWNGRWQEPRKEDGSQRFPSQSEADFALIDILAFYTQTPEQIIRMFRQSGMFRPDKDRVDYFDRMVLRAFDKVPPALNLDVLHSEMLAAQARFATMREEPAYVMPDLSVAFPVPQPTQALPAAVEPVQASSVVAASSPYTRPPGLVGDLAAFIYAASARPVDEIAITAALAFMAGMCGHAYNVSGTGVNLYLILLAKTGMGKEGMAGGIDRIIAQMSTFDPSQGADGRMFPAIKEYRGPSGIASGPALIKNMARQRSNVTILGEFGYRMQQLVTSTNPADISLKTAFLDLYNKSGHGNVIYPHVYSDKAQNTEAIEGPALTLLGETTPEIFYSVVDERMISDGLLPRFSIIEYHGERPPLNEAAFTARLPHDVRVRLFDMLTNIAALSVVKAVDPNDPNKGGNRQVVNVILDPEATNESRGFGMLCDRFINDALNDSIRNLWNRAHIKTLKIAALVAIGIAPNYPVISRDAYLWAKGIVVHEINMLLQKFERGELLEKNPFKADERKQYADVARIILEYYNTDGAILHKKYNIDLRLKEHFFIAQAYIHRRVANVASFRKDSKDVAQVLKRALDFLSAQNAIAPVPTRQPEIVNAIGTTNALLWTIPTEKAYETLVSFNTSK